MTKRVLCFSGLVAVGLSIACGSEEAATGPQRDYPTVPEMPSDPNVVRFELTEQTVPAHSDVVLCHYLDVTEEEMYVRAFESFQGKSGHHLIIFKARVPDAPGTVRDCTSPEDMIRFTPVISSVQFGLERFPDGMAIRVPRGVQIVLQQHYVNTTPNDLLVKDVAFMTKVPQSEVRELAGFYGLSDIFFELPPGEETVLKFDCTAPRDMNVLLVGPHMHEWGTRFRVTHTNASGSNDLINLEWRADYRDAPPTRDFGKESPLVLKAGDKLSTECVFRNTTSKTLKFPEEMCATYGYFFPAVAGEDEFICAGEDN
jgi:hypothetical protein